MQREHSASSGPVSVTVVLHRASVARRDVASERVCIAETRAVPGSVDEKRVDETFYRLTEERLST
jgi:hypothetical protein